MFDLQDITVEGIGPYFLLVLETEDMLNDFAGTSG